MKLLHFADLHLDAPFAWAGPVAAARRRRNRRETLVRIVELAEAEGVDAVLCGGDLFEHDRVHPDTLEFIRATLARTTIPVYLAPGNHDWYSARSPYAFVDWPPNVTVFSEARLRPIALAEGLTLWGAAHRAPANTDDFFASFRPDRGGVHIALAHASERSALPWQDTDTQPHAAFDAAELEAADIAHAFLGHFHLPRDAARHTYPGNPDPLDFGEEGERAAVVAEIAPSGAVERRRVRVAVSPVHDVVLSVDGLTHSDDVLARAATLVAGLSGFVRLTLIGELGPAAHLDPRELAALGAHLDALIVIANRLEIGYDLAAIEREPTIRGQFVRDAAAIDDPDRRRRVILTGLRALEGRTDLEVA